MKITSRILALCMALVMLFTVAGCGGKSTDGGSNKKTEESKKNLDLMIDKNCEK